MLRCDGSAYAYAQRRSTVGEADLTSLAVRKFAAKLVGCLCEFAMQTRKVALANVRRTLRVSRAYIFGFYSVGLFFRLLLSVIA